MQIGLFPLIVFTHFCQKTPGGNNEKLAQLPSIVALAFGFATAKENLPSF